MDVSMYMKWSGTVAIFSNRGGGGGVRDRSTPRTGDRRAVGPGLFPNDPGL